MTLMKEETETKDDGRRYIIFYTFEDEEDEGSGEGSTS